MVGIGRRGAAPSCIDAIGTARSAAGDRMPHHEHRAGAAGTGGDPHLLHAVLRRSVAQRRRCSRWSWRRTRRVRHPRRRPVLLHDGAATGAEPIPDGYTMADYMAQADDERPMGAYYTVRRWDAERRRMTIWVVLHGHDAGAGGWSERCRVGDRVVIWGPQALVQPARRGAAATAASPTRPASPRSPPCSRRRPPVGRRRSCSRPPTSTHTIDLSGFPDATVHWLFRGDDEAGTGDALAAARFAALDLDPAGLVAFGAAESRQITAVRATSVTTSACPRRACS